MKKYFIILTGTLLIISSCSLKVDPLKAKKLAESLISDLRNENFANLDSYYISSFNESEPLAKKIEKYNRLKEVTGYIVSYELLGANEKYNDYSNISELELIYKVTCSKLTVKETFRVINDAGAIKIIYHNVENMK